MRIRTVLLTQLKLFIVIGCVNSLRPQLNVVHAELGPNIQSVKKLTTNEKPRRVLKNSKGTYSDETHYSSTNYGKGSSKSAKESSTYGKGASKSSKGSKYNKGRGYFYGTPSKGSSTSYYYSEDSAYRQSQYGTSRSQSTGYQSPVSEGKNTKYSKDGKTSNEGSGGYNGSAPGEEYYGSSGKTKKSGGKTNKNNKTDKAADDGSGGNHGRSSEGGSSGSSGKTQKSGGKNNKNNKTGEAYNSSGTGGNHGSSSGGESSGSTGKNGKNNKNNKNNKNAEGSDSSGTGSGSGTGGNGNSSGTGTGTGTGGNGSGSGSGTGTGGNGNSSGTGTGTGGNGSGSGTGGNGNSSGTGTGTGGNGNSSGTGTGTGGNGNSSGNGTGTGGNGNSSGTGTGTGGNGNSSGTGTGTGGNGNSSGTGTGTGGNGTGTGGDGNSSGTGTGTGGNGNSSGTGTGTGGNGNSSGTGTGTGGNGNSSGTGTGTGGNGNSSGTGTGTGGNGNSGISGTSGQGVDIHVDEDGTFTCKNQGDGGEVLETISVSFSYNVFTTVEESEIPTAVENVENDMTSYAAIAALDCGSLKRRTLFSNTKSNHRSLLGDRRLSYLKVSPLPKDLINGECPNSSGSKCTSVSGEVTVTTEGKTQDEVVCLVRDQINNYSISYEANQVEGVEDVVYTGDLCNSNVASAIVAQSSQENDKFPWWVILLIILLLLLCCCCIGCKKSRNKQDDENLDDASFGKIPVKADNTIVSEMSQTHYDVGGDGHSLVLEESNKQRLISTVDVHQCVSTACCNNEKQALTWIQID